MRDLGPLQPHLEQRGLPDSAVLIELDARHTDLGLVIRRTNRIHDNGWDGTFRGGRYFPDSIAWSDVQLDLEARRPGFTLTLQNVRQQDGAATCGPQLPYSDLIVRLDEELNGAILTLYIVAVSLLPSGEGQVFAERRWYVSGGTLQGSTMTVRVGPPADALVVNAPDLPIASETCVWDYGKGPCTNLPSENGIPTCPKTPAACRERTAPGAPLPFSHWFVLTKSSRRRVG